LFALLRFSKPLTDSGCCQIYICIIQQDRIGQYADINILKNDAMNSDLFTRWLQTEAEILYHQSSTPEAFMNRAKPLIEALVKVNKSELLSEKDLQEILTASKSQKNPDTVKRNSYFDIVDLCLYRAN